MVFPEVKPLCEAKSGTSTFAKFGRFGTCSGTRRRRCQAGGSCLKLSGASCRDVALVPSPPDAGFPSGTNQRRDRSRDRALEGPLGSDRGAIENLTRSSNTPATKLASDLLTSIAVDSANDERFPDGTILIPADSPDTSLLISRAIADRRPMALVFADGSDIVARPPESHGLALAILVLLLGAADLLRRKRDAAAFVPSEWVTEFHAARQPEPVA